MKSTMDSTDFEYIVSSRLNATSPLTAELTCTEVCRKRFRLCGHEITLPCLPEQTIVHHVDFIPLNTQNDVIDITRSSKGTTLISRSSKGRARISQIMRRFGVNNYGCSTILRQIDAAIISSSSRRGGVVEVKIWKIKTKVYDIDKATERVLIERYCYDTPLRVLGHNNNGSIVEEEKECAICLENYGEGSTVVKSPCHHDFHGVCIYKWLEINHLCPLCRFPISN